MADGNGKRTPSRGLLALAAALIPASASLAQDFFNNPCDEDGARLEIRQTAQEIIAARKGLGELSPAALERWERDMGRESTEIRVRYFELCRDSPVVLQELLESAYRLGHLQDGLRIADALVELTRKQGDPKLLARSLVLRADGLRRTGDRARAEADIARAITFDQDIANASGFRVEVATGLFRCVVPTDWRRTDERSGSDEEVEFSGSSQTIRVSNFGRKDSRFAATDLFWKDPRFRQVKTRKSGKATIEAASVPILSRRYRLPDGDAPATDAGGAWVYEEYAVLPAPGSFWVLMFKTSDAPLGKSPAGQDIWHRFLASFKLEHPANPRPLLNRLSPGPR